MPRPPKRRSDAISRDGSSSPEPDRPNQPPHPRRPSSPPSSTSSDDNISSSDNNLTQAITAQKTLVKKLIRLALATEYARQPLRRTDIATKVFKESGASGRSFKTVFAQAQITLGEVFGMRLVELPGREKTGMKQRRAQATQMAKEKNSKKKGESQGTEGGGGKSWILVSVLPDEYKRNADVVVPAKAPTVDIEAGYTALYSFVVAVTWLNGNELSEGKMERYMERVNVGAATEWGSWDRVLARMVREGYVDRRKEPDEGWIYTVGPRGKVEVGIKGIEGLVKTVYGVGVNGVEEANEAEEEGENANPAASGKLDEEELNKRLTRSLGVSVGGQTQEVQMVDGDDDTGSVQEPEQSRRSGRRKGARDDDDD